MESCKKKQKKLLGVEGINVNPQQKLNRPHGNRTNSIISLETSKIQATSKNDGHNSSNIHVDRQIIIDSSKLIIPFPFWTLSGL